MTHYKPRSPEEKAKIIRAFRNRGDQSSADFFKQHKMSNSLIYTWMAEEKKANQVAHKKTPPTPYKNGMRKYDDAFVNKVLAEADKGGKPFSEIAKENGVHASMLYYWRQRRDGTLKPKVRRNGAATSPEETPASVRHTEALVMLRRAEAGLQAELNGGTVKKERMWHLQMKFARALLEGG